MNSYTGTYGRTYASTYTQSYGLRTGTPRPLRALRGKASCSALLRKTENRSVIAVRDSRRPTRKTTNRTQPRRRP